MRVRALKALLLIVLAVTSTLVFAPTANAAPKNQCLYTVTGKDSKGMFTLSSERCFSTYAEVLRASGGKNVPDSVSASRYTSAALASGIIGTHYDGTNGTGASVSVAGSDCSGGGLNLPPSWNDRISSTTNGCPVIAHFENANYTGSVFATSYGTNDITGYMDNRTSSIKYLNQ